MGEGAAVIARRGGDEAAFLRLVTQGQNGIGGAAQLEAAGRLMAFELEMDRRAATGGSPPGLPR